MGLLFHRFLAAFVTSLLSKEKNRSNWGAIACITCGLDFMKLNNIGIELTHRLT